MLAEYKTKTNLFILFGIALQIASRFTKPTEVGNVLVVVGAILFIIGCCFYAKGKGHSGAFGLLGLFNLIGLIVLVCMRDKCK